jgi:amidophosphoribosyltransferase
MCGIIGIASTKDVIQDVLFGLSALQHRGQNACGIATFNDVFHVTKGLGLISTVFNQQNAAPMTGKMGLGHVRYATQGSDNLLNAQPFTSNFPFGIAMIHNGNIINFDELRKSLNERNHYLLETTNDLELILYTFASYLAKKNLNDLHVEDIFDAVTSTQQDATGAYATISLIANRGLLAFTDPHGIRPLSIGRKKEGDSYVYAFASESTCFDFLGYELLDDLKPGEAVFVDMQNRLHRKVCVTAKRSFCIFEYIYFAREDSILHNKLVATERMRMGKVLAKKIQQAGLQPDIVIDVPSSAYFFATELAEQLGVPYRRGLAKNNHIGRSFILSSQQEREATARLKLNPIKHLIQGKKVVVVDDSIVRGTTSKHIVTLLRNAGAKEIYFVSAAPPIKSPCIYGIDMAISSELIGRNTLEDIRQYLAVDALIYQSLDDLKELYKDEQFCYACFDGKYPIERSMEYLHSIEADRKENTVKGSC